MSSSQAQTLVTAFAAVFEAAPILAALCQWGSLPSRANFRNALVGLVEGTDDNEGRLSGIRQKLGNEAVTALSHAQLVRLPALAVQGDWKELEFRVDQDFEQTDGLSVCPKDGPLVLVVELATRDSKPFYGTMTRTLLWPRDISHPPVTAATSVLMSALLRFISDAGTLDIDVHRVQAQVIDSLERKCEVQVDKLLIDSVRVTEAFGAHDETDKALMGPPQREKIMGLCVRACVSLDGGKDQWIGLERPFQWDGRAAKWFDGTAEVELCPVITQFRTAEENPLWVLTSYESKSVPDRNLFYNPSVSMSQVVGDTALRRAIQQHFVGTMGMSISDLMSILGPSASQFTYMRPFLIHVIALVRPDVPMLRDILLLTQAVLEDLLDPDETSTMPVTYERDGDWEDGVDTVALERTVVVLCHLCHVYPLEVVNLLKYGEYSIGPQNATNSFWGDDRWCRERSSKEYFALGFFGMLSRRVPAALIGSTGARTSLKNSLWTMLRKNMYRIQELGVPEGTEMRWRDFRLKSEGKAILNRLAASKRYPMSTLDIKVDDWDKWYRTLDPHERDGMDKSAREAFDLLLWESYTQAFPTAAQTGAGGFMRKVKELVTSLRAESETAKNPNEAYWGRTTYMKVAQTMWILDRKPTNQTFAFNNLELDILHLCAPFANRSQLHNLLYQHSPQIQIAYDIWVTRASANGISVRSHLTPMIPAAQVEEILLYRDKVQEWKRAQ